MESLIRKLMYGLDEPYLEKIAKFIIGLGVFNINKETEYCYPILIHAIDEKEYKTVKFLLENGANVNAFDKTHRINPLIHACSANIISMDIFNILIEYGADVHATTKNNENALSVACSCEHIDAVRTLIELGCDPNLRYNNDINGINAIILSIIEGYYQILYLLLECPKTNINIKYNNNSILSYAIWHVECDKCINIIKERYIKEIEGCIKVPKDILKEIMYKYL